VGLDGTWTVTPTADTNVLYVGYRVDEVIAGQAITATGRSAAVTGSLTLAGTQATPVVFADYNITNPSIGPITTEDNGALEFLIVFDRQQP
jgi:hypothetical protein